MAFDERLAARVREIVAGREGLTERKMFGGLCFMLNGNMYAGIVHDDLMLRVGLERFEEALAHEHVRPMDFAGRPMAGMVYVAPPAIQTREELSGWLDQAFGFVETLPGKQPGSKSGKTRSKKTPART